MGAAGNFTRAETTIDARELRKCLGAFVTGVTVITTIDAAGIRHGLTANSFSSVSLDPPLVLWSQRLNSGSYPIFREVEVFAINILSADQIGISQRFATPGENKFKDIPTASGIGGLPIIEGCAAYLECRKETTYPGGDHAVFLGRVERIQHTGREPLAFGNGRYMVVNPHDQGSLTDDLGLAAAVRPGSVGKAGALLERLSRTVDLTVGLAVWGNCGPTIIRWQEAGKPLKVGLRTGLVLPVLTSASGLAFASHLPKSLTMPFIDAEFKTTQRGHQYDDGPQTYSELDDVLNRIRRLGFAQTVDRRGPASTICRINAISSPVFDDRGVMVMALTLMSNPDELGTAIDAKVDQLKAAARELSAQLGHDLDASDRGTPGHATTPSQFRQA